MVDDGAGANNGVVVADDFAQQATVGKLEGDTADRAVDAGAEDGSAFP